MKILVSIFLFLFTLNVYSEIKDARIEVDSIRVDGVLTEKFYGSFWEYYHFWFNSPVGLSAQEIQNRGFDLTDYTKENAKFWKYLNYNDHTYSLEKGGYNENGEYYQRIENNTGQISGIYQTVYISPDSSHTFYAYFKSDTPGININITMTNPNNNATFFNHSFTLNSKEWKKITFTIPPLNSVYKANLMISYQEDGILDIDEVSLVSDDNIHGFRKVYYDLYKEWNPGLIRFPGGFFADTDLSHWQYSVGEIDKRKSPLIFDSHSQRFEIGTHEFVDFCRSIGAEPQIVANLKNGSPEESAAWLEYCNGSVESKYGQLRYQNGYKEPLKVKYWEIGNEQWDDPVQLSKDFALHAEKMKEVDSDIYLFMGGNNWAGLSFFTKSLKDCHEYVDNYGFHYAWSIEEESIDDNDAIFLSMAANTKSFEKHINNIEKWISDYYPDQNMKQSVTEAWIYYNDWDWYLNPRLFTMENGIWTAIINNKSMRHPNTMTTVERTHNSGMFFTLIDSISGKKYITPSPAFYACMMQNKHRGDTVLATNVFCEEFSVDALPGTYPVKDVPYIDATSTIANDSLYISIINKSPNDTFKIHIDIDTNLISNKANVYLLAGDSTLDGPSPINPEGITPTQSTYILEKGLLVAPHSLNILAFPRIDKGNLLSNSSNSDLIIMPNPCKDKIQVSLKTPISSYATISLYDISGSLIKTEELTSSSTKHTIDMRGLPKGTYMLKFKEKDRVLKSAFLKSE